MSLDRMQQQLLSLAKMVDGNEKLATPILAAKLDKFLEIYPGDQTLGAMSRVIRKMAENKATFIRRDELRNLYQKLYSRNTKFAELFQAELGATSELPSPTTMARDEAQEPLMDMSDPILSNALQSVFDPKIPVKMYSQSVADKALKSVVAGLDAWNVKPSYVNIEAGNEKFLVIKADYDTPKGKTSFYVPVETVGNKVIEASVFVGHTGLQDLNHRNVKSYLTSYAGGKARINGVDLLEALTKSATEKREVSDTEIALIKLRAGRQVQADFFDNQIVGQQISEENAKDVEMPKYEEFVSFEKTFTSPFGVAALQFGEESVKLGRQHIVRELAGFGYRNPQIKITGSDKNSIFYGISLDAGRVAFTVPVKIKEGKLVKPGMILCNGSVSSFNKEEINQLYVNNQTDYKVAAVASPMFDLKPSDLINNIRSAVAEGNLAKAEDALNVLSNTGDEKAYAFGFQAYLQGLSSKTEMPETSCSMSIKNAKVSQHPICGHTGLPVHQVYQDKDGNCRPLYRKGMDETYEAASFMNAKIFG